ncbi:conserved Plasmodium protein, unknown function [Plasmodium malariae]|uniref:Methyltransferase n=1 Tax=Plasmodium malariae TaxID=5858 RepID=A0A1C3KFP8_PLAMA|nr:conserved Plasmodium protein, unknown function [Plasmodium malariae]
MIKKLKIKKGGNFKSQPHKRSPKWGMKKSNHSYYFESNSKLMHDRNIHKNNFINFEELSKKYPYLNIFLHKSKNGKLIYDFEKSVAVYFLSKAILKEYYCINFYMPYYNIDSVDGIDALFDSISLLYHNTIQNFVFVNSNELSNNYKEVILNAYNEHNDKLLKLDYKNDEYVINEPCDELKCEDTKSQNEFTGKKFLCPCIPGRVNYIHYLADLTSLNTISEEESTKNFERCEHFEQCKHYERLNIINSFVGSEHTMTSEVLHGNIIKVLDIGVGANCIYPLLGNSVYNWSFIGVDINLDSLKYGYINILLNNKEKDIILKYQKDKKKLFVNVVNDTDLFFFSMCNPPYHSFLEQVNRNPFRNLEANVDEVVYFDNEEYISLDEDTSKEVVNNNIKLGTLYSKEEESNVEYNKTCSSVNASGTTIERCEEMYYKHFNKNALSNEFQKEGEHMNGNEVKSHKNLGGEYSFIINMIIESRLYFYNIIWFTTLVSKFKNVKLIKKEIIKSMRLYNMYKKNQVDFLTTIIKNNIHFENIFFFRNVKKPSFQMHICQYRIFESHTSRITRWIICWSYYTEEHIHFLIKLFREKNFHV